MNIPVPAYLFLYFFIDRLLFEIGDLRTATPAGLKREKKLQKKCISHLLLKSMFLFFTGSAEDSSKLLLQSQASVTFK